MAGSVERHNDRSAARRRSRRLSAGILVLAIVLGAAALADPPPNPVAPFDLPGDGGLFPAAGDQTAPAVSRGAGMYLAAWTDQRSAFFDPGGQAGSGRDIYAARLDDQGNLLDTAPLVVNQDEGDQYDPVVVWNGENWLVIWTGTVPYGPAQQPIIEAVRVSAAGEILDPEPLLIWTGGTTRGMSGEHLLGAASDGHDWALVIVDQYVQGLGTNTRLVGRRITPEGVLVNAPYYLYSPSCCSFFYIGGLAYADGVYMAVFEGYVSGTEYGIFGLRMSPNLTTLDSYPVVLAQTAMQGSSRFYRTPHVAGEGGLFYVGWQLYTDGGGSQIYGARVDAQGHSLDGDGVPISDPLPQSLYQSPELAWDGTQWIAVWTVGSQYIARVDADGTVLDPGGTFLNATPGAFAGTGAGGLLFAYAGSGGSDPAALDIFQTFISPSLEAAGDQCISLGAPSQIQPDLAAGTSGYLLAYRSDVSGESRIMVRPLDNSGGATTGEPVHLAGGAVDLPRVAFDGDVFLVVWDDKASGEVRGRRLSETGDVLDTSDIVVMDGTAPAVTGRDGQFFVTAALAGGVGGVRLAADGTLIDDPPLVLGAGACVGPRTAVLGDGFLTVWEQADAADGSEIAMSLVRTDGIVVGPLDVTTPGDGLSHHRPAIAGGDPALLVWEDDRSGDGNIYGRRVSAPLSFVDPAAGFAITNDPNRQGQAAAAWDGSRFLTVFTDDRNKVNTLDRRADIYRNWVTYLGVVEEPSGLSLFSDMAPEVDPVVATLQDRALYAASVFDSEPPFAAYRLRLRYSALPGGVGDGTGGSPNRARLVSLYPNPANPAVKIRFTLSRPGDVRIGIFNLQGALLRTLRRDSLGSGEHVLHWDGRDAAGRDVPSGTYLLRFRGDGLQEVDKLALVR